MGLLGSGLTSRVCSILLYLLLSFSGLNAQAAKITIVSGNNQSVVIGAQFGEPFVVNLTEDDGTPIEGAQISFTHNFCIAPPTSPVGCPPEGSWGHFESGSTNAVAITDHNGNATAPAYFAGEVPSTDQSLIVFPVHPSLSFLDAWDAYELIHYSQVLVTATAMPVPSLSGFALVILCVLLMLVVYTQHSRRVLVKK